jgi:hypothetical protein
VGRLRELAGAVARQGAAYRDRLQRELLTTGG